MPVDPARQSSLDGSARGPAKPAGVRTVLRRGAARGATALLVSLVGLVAAPVVSAQERSVVYVRVLDVLGRPVTDLTAEEFRVFEGGRRARLVSATAGTEPMRIALLIDNGESIRAGHAVNALRDAVAAFLESLPPPHLVGLFTIGGHIRQHVDFTTDRAALQTAGASIFPDESGGVRLADGIRETLERRYDGDEAWPVFVVLVTSTGEASGFMNDRRYLRFINRLRAAGVIVHVVHWYVRGRDLDGSVSGLAPDLAGDTGGRYTSVVVPTAMANAMETLATDMGIRYRDLASRYRVVYERPDPPGASVTVRVERAGVGMTRLFPDRRLDP